MGQATITLPTVVATSDNTITYNMDGTLQSAPELLNRQGYTVGAPVVETKSKAVHVFKIEAVHGDSGQAVLRAAQGKHEVTIGFDELVAKWKLHQAVATPTKDWHHSTHAQDWHHSTHTQRQMTFRSHGLGHRSHHGWPSHVIASLRRRLCRGCSRRPQSPSLWLSRM